MRAATLVKRRVQYFTPISIHAAHEGCDCAGMAGIYYPP